MKYSLSHVANDVLLRDLARLVSQDRATTAALLAHIAEVDERRLYARAGYSSMHSYCIRELRMSEDRAFRRITVARTARQFTVIFEMIADGRLNLTSVLLLTPRLTPGNADELFRGAVHKSKLEIELLLAERFPQSDVPTQVRAVGPAVATLEFGAGPVGSQATQLAPERVGTPALQRVSESAAESATQAAPQQLASPLARPASEPARPRITPLSPGRFALQVTVDQETQEQLRYAQSLLGHAVPSGDVAEVLKRALNSLVRELEKKRFAKSARPSARRRGSANPRHVPAQVRRTVWQRDGGRCTFVGSNGRHCEERTSLELDHTEPLARGGRTVASNLRLRCRAHNQYEAERAFGSDFMRAKRDRARVAQQPAQPVSEPAGAFAPQPGARRAAP